MDLHPMQESSNISSRLMLQKPQQDAGFICRQGGREGLDDFYMIPRLGSVGLIPLVPHEKHTFLKILGPTPSPLSRKITSGPQALAERGTLLEDRLRKLLLHFTTDILMLGEEKRGGGCPRMSYCSTSSNCQGSVTDQNGEEVGLFLVTPGTCGSGFNTVCCTEFMYYGGL